MYTISSNGQSYKTQVQISGTDFKAEFNGKQIEGSFVKLNPYQFHLIYNNNSFNVDVIKINKEEKTVVVKINSVKYTLQLKDKYDELLKRLGMDALSAKKISDAKRRCRACVSVNGHFLRRVLKGTKTGLELQARCD